MGGLAGPLKTPCQTRHCSCVLLTFISGYDLPPKYHRREWCHEIFPAVIDGGLYLFVNGDLDLRDARHGARVVKHDGTKQCDGFNSFCQLGFLLISMLV